jgi:hypothetical protein
MVPGAPDPDVADGLDTDAVLLREEDRPGMLDRSGFILDPANEYLAGLVF